MKASRRVVQSMRHPSAGGSVSGVCSFKHIMQTYKGDRPNTALAIPPACDIQRVETPMA